MRSIRLLSCAGGALGAALAGGPSFALADEPTLEQRLEHLSEQLEAQRVELNIPGMAIAVVKDDEIIMARGFGQRDIDENLPADEHTLFAIGSSTKSFTAALVAMLVDEGKVDWDDPIRDHLPEFRLHDEDIAAQVTLRDTLSHRTGLNRTDLLWASGKASRAEIIEAIAQAELFSPFREKWHYNNIMFLAAGQAAGRAAGTDYDTMLAERIFQPLGMNATNCSYGAAQASEALSKGYIWDEEREGCRRLDMRKLDNIAPAGAINSNVLDMAQWVRLQLGRGEIDGKRLISEEQIEEMWSAQMEMAPSIDYGLGWFVRTWDDKRLIEHGGNIDGFAASMSLLPDENIGFVLLTNVTHTPLQSMCHGMVYSALLHDLDDADAPPAIDFDEYLGKYHFAMMDADFTVQVKDDALAVDVPGQMVYELKPPDEEGRWYFALTNEIAVSFERDDEGEVVAMKMYQGGMTFDLPREGAELPMEVDMEQVGPYLGTYHDPQMDIDVRVLVQNGRLAVDVPGQTIYELHQPDDEGRWYFRLTDTIHVTFGEDDDGEPTLTRHQGGDAIEMQRVEGDAAADVPSVEELLALIARGHNTERLDEIRTLRTVANIRMVHQGITGTVTTTAAGTDRVREDMDMGRFGYVNIGLAGDEAWVDSDIQKDDGGLTAAQRDDLRMRHPLLLFMDWRDVFDEVQVQPNKTDDERLVHVVKLSLGSVTRTVRIDAESGIIVGETISSVVPGLGRMSAKLKYDSHHEVLGVRLMKDMVMDSDLMGRVEATVTEVLVNEDVPDTAFMR